MQWGVRLRNSRSRLACGRWVSLMKATVPPVSRTARITVFCGGTSRSEPGRTMAPPSAQKSFIMSTTRTAVCGGDRVMLSSLCRWAEKLSIGDSRLGAVYNSAVHRR